MKTTIAYSIIASICVVLSFTACEKLGDFGDTNVNPSKVSYPETSALLTKVLSGLGIYSTPEVGPGNLSFPAGVFCQYFAENFYVYNGTYDDLKFSPMDNYPGDLYDLQNIINLNSDQSTQIEAAKDGPNENQIAIARILKVYIYWILTDCWGDIPYSDALKEDANVNYDTQEFIYQDLLNELEEVVEQSLSENIVKGDIVYNGDITKWKRLANSMRLLISLRLSKQYPLHEDYAASQFRSALEHEAGHIESNEDNFQLVYPGGNFKNPYFRLYDNSIGYVGESATMTSLLGSLNNDQRQTVFGADASGAPSDLGIPVGIKHPDNKNWCEANPTYCYILHPDYREQSDPLYLITTSQVLLARAEAADRGWTSETANTGVLYQEGISQSFLQWGLAAPDAAYFSHANVVLPEPPGTGANIAQIATQQYIAYYPSAVQGWCNWRRTAYPLLQPAIDAINNPPTIPRRFKYGPLDYELTPEAVEEAVARIQGGDEIESRVWWDKE